MTIQGILPDVKKTDGSTTTTPEISKIFPKIDYMSVIKQNFSLSKDNILTKYLPIGFTLILGLGMYLLGFISDCLGCGPFRSLVLFIYIFGISTFLISKTVFEQCKNKIKYLNELQMAGLSTCVFILAYIFLPILSYIIPGMAIINNLGPGKVLIPTLFGLIPYYFYLIHAMKETQNATCNGKEINII